MPRSASVDPFFIKNGHQSPECTTLMQRVALGDHDAFSALHELVSGAVFSVCYRILRDWPRAEDAAQQTMEDLWRSASRYEESLGSEIAWSLMIARRRAIDLVRLTRTTAARDLRFALEQFPGPFDVVAETAEQAWEVERVRYLFAQLTPRQRSAMHLVYYQGFTMEQTADALGVPLGTVKTRVRDGIARLRRDYDDSPVTTPPA